MITIIQFSFPLPVTSGDHRSDLFFSEFVFQSIIDLIGQLHISFLWTLWWFWYFYSLQIDHHNKSSYHLLQHKYVTLLLTVFPMQCISSLLLIYFIPGSLYLLIFLTFLLIPVLTSTSLSSVSVTLILMCFFVLFCFVYNKNLFIFVFCSWGSQGKNTEVVCHSLLQWTTFVRTLHHDPSVLGDPTQHGS